MWKGFKGRFLGSLELALLGLDRALSELDNERNPLDDEAVSCRFGVLGGSSFSSLLKVRSITWLIDLLEPVELTEGVEACCSLAGLA